VTFHGVSYITKGLKDPKEQKYTLRNVSGRCVWGKLTAIMGPNKSGKSSLLQVLSGNINSYESELTGDVFYNRTPIEEICLLPPWKRCAYVDTSLEVSRDLSVEEVVTFAMRLRCTNEAVLDIVDENVSRTMNLLHLEAVADVKTKYLSTGQLRLVNIAEEIVSGSSLLFLDEPLADLSIKEQSIVMKSLREMVNKDKTVVATFREPSNEVFDLFDHLILMSHGSIAYQGAAKDAVQYFGPRHEQIADSVMMSKIDTMKLSKAAYLLEAAEVIPPPTVQTSLRFCMTPLSFRMQFYFSNVLFIHLGYVRPVDGQLFIKQKKIQLIDSVD